jgi:amidase
VGLALEPALEAATVDPACLEAARTTAGVLEELGHHVEEAKPPWARQGLLPEFTKAFGPLTAMGTWYGARIAGRDPEPADVEPLTWEMWERANAHSSLDLLTAQATLERFARELVASLAPYDVVITPALAQPPVPIGEIHGRGPDPMGHYRLSGAFTPYTAIVNVTGLPAISVPVAQTDSGLPLAVQLIGPPAREEVVLRAARQLEIAMPWADRRPPLP